LAEINLEPKTPTSSKLEVKEAFHSKTESKNENEFGPEESIIIDDDIAS